MQSKISNKIKMDNVILEKLLEVIKTTPNDMVLGEKIRKIYNQIINSEK
jgi:hypothetical protein